METALDYKQLLTDIIKKQMVLLGPDLTLAQVKKVAGITVSEDGTVTDMQGDAKMLMHDVINAFVELSGDIVKKAMEPLFAAQAEPAAAKIELPAAPIQPEPEVAKPVPTATETTPVKQPSEDNRPIMKVEEVPAPLADQSLSMPTVTPAPQPMTSAPTEPQPEVASVPAMPTTTPLEQPAAQVTPTPQIVATPTPQGAPPTAAPAANPQAQTDPDMQHIINEALKQTT